MVTLGGLDAIVLTATASERSPFLRQTVLSGLEAFGIEVDDIKNEETVGREGLIHKENGLVKISVMKTDEMGEIARIAAEIDAS